MFSKQFVLALLILHWELVLSFDWDIVLAGEKRLEFFYNGTVTYTEDIPFANSIRSVTYDPVHYRVLFAEYHSEKLSILYNFDLTTMKTQTLVMKQTSERCLKHLAYDPVTQIVFWTECKKIYSLSLKPASSIVAVDGNLIATADYSYVGDIDVDSCGGYIYWVTEYKIERAAFDGSEREVLINDRVYFRRSLAIDQQTKTMYWIEESTRFYHCIESADLSGKNRRTFYIIGKEPHAYALTVSKDFIYWKSFNQTAILQLPKHQQHAVAPVVYRQSSRHCDTCQITAANYNIEEQTLGNDSCEALKILKPEVEERHGSICHNYCFQGYCTVSAEGHPECSCEDGYSGERCEVNPCHMYCLNNGVCSLNEAEKPVCRCTADYQGKRCDDSICKNYCLQGNCSVTTEGQPNCRCNAGYSGERCEVNACHEHCLNNGDCSLNEEDEPICQCTADYDGKRCEVSVCQDNCVSAEGQPNSRCKASYSGNRCEQNPCRGFCLNNGVCSLHEGDEPVCRCSADYGGDRCELPAVLIKCIQTVSMFREMLSADITSVNQGKGVKSKFAASVV